MRLLVWVVLAVAVFGLAGPGFAAPGAKSLSVAATTTFLSTGVVLTRGESVLITVTGTISYGS